MRISVRNLSHEYAAGIEAIRGIDLSVSSGEIVLLLGHNGAGKSTLLKHLNGVLKPTSGEVLIGDINTRSADVSALASHIALTFQNPDDQIFSSTVFEEVSFGPRNIGKENFTELAEEAMTLFDLKAFSTSHPYDLHASKRKLITIASALAMDTPILAFDEPSSGLDSRQRGLLGSALDILRSKRKTVVIVSHDLDYFYDYCSSIVMMERGRIIYSGSKSDLGGRRDARALLSKSGLRVPILWRIARFAELTYTPASRNELVILIASKAHDH